MVKKDTIIRTIILFMALINNLLIAFNKNPFPYSDTQIFQFLSTTATAITAIIAWWKNNSFTKHAIHADAILKNKKDENH